MDWSPHRQTKLACDTDTPVYIAETVVIIVELKTVKTVATNIISVTQAVVQNSALHIISQAIQEQLYRN